MGKWDACADSCGKVLDKDGSQVNRVCFISRARGESIQSGQFDKCSLFGKSGRRTSLKCQEVEVGYLSDKLDKSRISRVTQRSHLNRITQIPSVTGKLGISHENLMSRVGRASQGMLGQSGRAVPLGNVYELELVW